jgi:hypothetical protein
MCGIFGWQLGSQPEIDKVQRAILGAFLAQKNDNRGGDSYGWWAPGGRSIEGGVVRGLGLIAPHARMLAPHPTLMGHTRKATTGDVKEGNAHPFLVDGIIGAHNGMVYNHSEIQAKYNRKFEVDSMHLFAHIAAGLDFKELQGYGAVEYVDTKKMNRVYLCKMSGGDLNIIGLGKSAKAVNGVVWSSDKDHLKLALDVAGVEDYFHYKVESGKRYMVQDGALFESGLPDLELGVRSYTTTTTYGNGRSFHQSHFLDNFDNEYPRGPAAGPASNIAKRGTSPTSDEEKTFYESWQKRLTDDNWPEMPEWDKMSARQRTILVSVIEKVERDTGLRGVEYHDANDASGPAPIASVR